MGSIENGITIWKLVQTYTVVQDENGIEVVIAHTIRVFAVNDFANCRILRTIYFCPVR